MTKLDDIKRLIEGATPGPWSLGDTVGMTDGIDDYGPGCSVVRDCIRPGTVADVIAPLYYDYEQAAIRVNDARFIAASRDLLPKLASIVEALDSVLSEEGVREYLASYVMGVELMNRREALEAE